MSLPKTIGLPSVARRQCSEPGEAVPGRRSLQGIIFTQASCRGLAQDVSASVRTRCDAFSRSFHAWFKDS